MGITHAKEQARSTELRRLQDAFLRLPHIAGHIRRLGWGGIVAGPGSPKLTAVRDMVLSEWEAFFRSWF